MCKMNFKEEELLNLCRAGVYNIGATFIKLAYRYN